MMRLYKIRLIQDVFTAQKQHRVLIRKSKERKKIMYIKVCVGLTVPPAVILGSDVRRGPKLYTESLFQCERILE
jgi:hypothetical protein